MGYEDVRIYRQGIIGWAKSGLNLEHEKQYPEIKIPLISSQAISTDRTKFRIIDIRPKSHFIKGHIAGAENIDLEVMHLRYNELTSSDNVLLVDHKGKLTLTTGRYLASKGIRNVSRLDGGFNAWVKHGNKVSKAVAE